MGVWLLFDTPGTLTRFQNFWLNLLIDGSIDCGLVHGGDRDACIGLLKSLNGCTVFVLELDSKGLKV